MVFFNYSTMQMAAKVVYYGPGLCGKTTNLHYIYQHTTQESRGEMVSLETETDRTLFFDLLPIDVGSIAGFNTRIQLYTVPGQVFYNTTRKLVLKGVDGVVFVADSQRAMLQTNAESFRNLEDNLAEMGLTVDTLPLVLQFNKRDLADICTVEEMNAALNRHNWPWFESSARDGHGSVRDPQGDLQADAAVAQEAAGPERALVSARTAGGPPRPGPCRRRLPRHRQRLRPRCALPCRRRNPRGPYSQVAPAPPPRAPPGRAAAGTLGTGSGGGSAPAGPGRGSGAPQGPAHRQDAHHGRALRAREAASGGHAAASLLGLAAGASGRHQRPGRAVARRSS